MDEVAYFLFCGHMWLSADEEDASYRFFPVYNMSIVKSKKEFSIQKDKCNSSFSMAAEELTLQHWAG